MNVQAIQQTSGPLARGKEIETYPHESDSRSPQHAGTVLIMEDDDVVRQSMAAYLADRGYNVLEAADGRIGLEIFLEQKPDLVLVDLRMPEVDGLQVIDVAVKESPNVPLIVVSGYNTIATAMEALHLGAWDYLLKPLDDMAVLQYAVEVSLQRARLIEENRRYRQRLEDLVQERTAQLERMVESLESKNAELERFAYTVSHDLKSPLITIQGFLGILEQSLGELCTGEIKCHLTRITKAADRMFLFLGDLLELSRIGRLVNPPADVSMTELAREAVDAVSGEDIVGKIQFDIEENMPIVHVDAVRMREVWQNLVENAVKFMGDQPNPKIEIGIRRDDEPVFFVRDNGVGIDPQFQGKIFGLFDRLDPKAEGTGVGLALVKRILEVHGGRIWIESEGEGKGSTFCFTLATPEG